jgi:hypothetical protein
MTRNEFAALDAENASSKVRENRFSERFVPLQRSRRPALRVRKWLFWANCVGNTSLRALLFDMAQIENLCHALESL